MRIIIQDPLPDQEEHIVIVTKTMTDKLSRVINILKSPESLTVYDGDKALILQISSVYYVENVDQKNFIYAEKVVYRSRLKMAELEEMLCNDDFLRVNRNTIVNVRKVRSVAPAGGGKFAAELTNGEMLIISRQFVPLLKRRFGL